jgi:hypothetical protein
MEKPLEAGDLLNFDDNTTSSNQLGNRMEEKMNSMDNLLDDNVALDNNPQQQPFESTIQPSDPFGSPPKESLSLEPPLLPTVVQPPLLQMDSQISIEEFESQKKTSLDSVASKPLPEPVSTLNLTTGLAPPLSSTSVLSPKTPVSTRLNPIPPSVSPVHFNLPTRRWTDPTSFADIPFKDALGETISKMFSHLPQNQRPQKPSVTLAHAVEMSDPYGYLVNLNQ